MPCVLLQMNGAFVLYANKHPDGFVNTKAQFYDAIRNINSTQILSNGYGKIFTVFIIHCVVLGI